ncbi:MAG: nucleotidyltransferase domain-containing protein [Nanoarchaeota archaeon]|nr:nucleotidyltransferase domain-containing protein [Nanoarchaeota archaeon]
MLKKEIEILSLFRNSIFLKTTILDISKKLKKHYPKIYDSVKELEKNKTLKIEKVGHSNLVSLLLNPQTIRNLSFLDEQEAMQKNIPNYEKLMSLKEISQYLVILTGSYAKGKATKTSDLDLVIIIPDDKNAFDIQKKLENIFLLFHPPIHLYVFNNKDIVEMLIDKKENYGKEIFKNHIILKNAYIYYELLKEAIENGFKG